MRLDFVEKRLYPATPTLAQNAIVSMAGANLVRKKFGRGFVRFLRNIEESQWWSESELVEYQLLRLKELVRFAFSNSVYYRRAFDREGLKPDAIKELEDLKRIPILTKETIRYRLPEIAPLHLRRLKLELEHTSGTTGTGLHIYWDREAIMKEYAFVARHRRWAGVQPFDLQATFGGRIVVARSRKSPPFWRTNVPERQVFFSMYHLSRNNANHYISKLRSLNPDFVQGYPSLISTISEFSHEMGTPLFGPKAVFTSSETLLDSQRKSIEQAFGCGVFDWYGSSELAASIGQCEKGRYHLNSEYGIVEVDSDSSGGGNGGGEMICTSFVNYGTPLLRYRIGDLIRMSSTRCPCGRGLPVVEEIVGRRDDIVVTPTGVCVGRMDHIFKDAINVREAQVIQEASDELRILIVRRPEFADSDLVRLRNEFRTRFGDEMKLSFEFVDRIPREATGKFRSVISKIHKGGDNIGQSR